MNASLLLLLLIGCTPQRPVTEEERSALFVASETKSAPKSQNEWAIASSAREFSFPSDHGVHEDFRIEWWYYTGNLTTSSGRQFGYQMTFFRTGLNKEPQNPSRWAVRDLYTAHFAISDVQTQQHYFFERNSRRGIDQAGALSQRYEVWNGNWKVFLSDEGHRLQAADGEVAVDLTLVPTKEPVLHGERGLSQKGPTKGNASYYYSQPRMRTSGSIRIGEEAFVISGDSWMDHEFSSSFLERGQLGWDWLSIQLDNNVELMLYRMRRQDGTADPYSSGTLITASGDVQHLDMADFQMSPLQSWQSVSTEAQYPLHWRITIPSLGYRLKVRPAFDAQEMRTENTTGISYWEGAILVTGERDDGEALNGRGYMELTGYAGEGLGSLFD